MIWFFQYSRLRQKRAKIRIVRKVTERTAVPSLMHHDWELDLTGILLAMASTRK